MKQKKRKKRRYTKKLNNSNNIKCTQVHAETHVYEDRERLSLFEKLVYTMTKPKKRIHFIIAIVAVIIGFIFNVLDDMPMFWLKGLLGFVLYLILFYTLMFIKEQNQKLEIELTGDPQLVKCQTKYKMRINSNLNFLLCIVACVYFVSISVILDFVELNLIGIYSLIALSCVVFCAFIIFQQYIFLLFLLRDISKIKPGKFFEMVPERTEWFKLIEKFSNICRNCFIVLGSLFIILFITFSPVNSIQIIFREKFLSIQFIPLLITWIIILVAIICMIPFSSLLRSYFLQKIYGNLIGQSIQNYSKLYASSKDESKILYLDIILRINDRKYVLQNSYTWIIPVIATLLNYTSLIVSIITDLRELNLFT